MDSIALTQDLQPTNKAEWLVICEAILRFESFSSLDDLLSHALNAWLQQVAPQLRWQVAIDLYTTEQVSLGRAAEIAGLNYFVFQEKLNDNDIPLVEAEVTTDIEKEKQKAIVHEVFNLS